MSLPTDAARAKVELTEVNKALLEEIKTNHATTTEHNKAIRRLTIAIIVLTALTVVQTLVSTCSNKERYAISGSWESGVIIGDTRTGQVWMRQGRGMYDLGTIDKPKYDKMRRVLGGGQSSRPSTIEEMTDK